MQSMIVERKKREYGTENVRRTDRPLMAKVKETAAQLLPRRGFRAACVICAVALALLMAGSGFFHVCYAVTVDGVKIGTVTDKNEIQSAREHAESRATEILGRPVILSNISFRRELEPRNAGTADAEELSDRILASVDGIEPMYVISVDGEPVGAVEAEKKALALLNEVVAEYSEGAQLANISQTVSVERDFVNTETMACDEEEILELLRPENKDSRSSLDIKTIELREYNEIIPFETEYVEDETMYTDEETVETEGMEGLAHVTAYVQCLNGEATEDRTVLSSEILAEPVARVIRRGTMVRPSTDSVGAYIWPTDGIITSYFGYRSDSVGSSYHEGLDIAGAYRQSVCAADGGEVFFAEYSGGYGNVVKVLHDNGEVTCYAHLDEIIVSAGERVYQGQQIGYMGTTGISSGDHLHFEIRVDGSQVDPLPFLP